MQAHHIKAPEVVFEVANINIINSLESAQTSAKIQRLISINDKEIPIAEKNLALNLGITTILGLLIIMGAGAATMSGVNTIVTYSTAAAIKAILFGTTIYCAVKYYTTKKSLSADEVVNILEADPDNLTEDSINKLNDLFKNEMIFRNAVKLINKRYIETGKHDTSKKKNALQNLTYFVSNFVSDLKYNEVSFKFYEDFANEIVLQTDKSVNLIQRTLSESLTDTSNTLKNAVDGALKKSKKTTSAVSKGKEIAPQQIPSQEVENNESLSDEQKASQSNSNDRSENNLLQNRSSLQAKVVVLTTINEKLPLAEDKLALKLGIIGLIGLMTIFGTGVVIGAGVNTIATFSTSAALLAILGGTSIYWSVKYWKTKKSLSADKIVNILESDPKKLTKESIELLEDLFKNKKIFRDTIKLINKRYIKSEDPDSSKKTNVFNNLIHFASFIASDLKYNDVNYKFYNDFARAVVALKVTESIEKELSEYNTQPSIDICTAIAECFKKVNKPSKKGYEQADVTATKDIEGEVERLGINIVQQTKDISVIASKYGFTHKLSDYRRKKTPQGDRLILSIKLSVSKDKTVSKQNILSMLTGLKQAANGFDYQLGAKKTEDETDDIYVQFSCPIESIEIEAIKRS